MHAANILDRSIDCNTALANAQPQQQVNSSRRWVCSRWLWKGVGEILQPSRPIVRISYVITQNITVTKFIVTVTKYIAGRRTNLVVYGWRPKPPTQRQPKTIPTFLSHAQSVILHIWQEAHGLALISARSSACAVMTEFEYHAYTTQEHEGFGTSCLV